MTIYYYVMLTVFVLVSEHSHSLGHSVLSCRLTTSLVVDVEVVMVVVMVMVMVQSGQKRTFASSPRTP